MSHGVSDGSAPPPAVLLRPTTPADLAFVVELERSPGVKPFVSPWWPEQHESALVGDRYEHLIIEADGERSGYAILDRRPEPFDGVPEGAVDLLRIAVAPRERGIGRAALRLITGDILTRPGATALSLDVLDDNANARALYISEGFVEVGAPVDGLVEAGRVA